MKKNHNAVKNINIRYSKVDVKNKKKV